MSLEFLTRFTRCTGFRRFPRHPVDHQKRNHPGYVMASMVCTCFSASSRNRRYEIASHWETLTKSEHISNSNKRMTKYTKQYIKEPQINIQNNKATCQTRKYVTVQNKYVKFRKNMSKLQNICQYLKKICQISKKYVKYIKRVKDNKRENARCKKTCRWWIEWNKK